MIRGLCFPYFKVLLPILNISSAMCCLSLKPEILCALGYLDLCLWQLNFIRGIEFRIFTVGRNAKIQFGECHSVIQTVIREIASDWHFDYTPWVNSWQLNQEIFKEVSQLFAAFYIHRLNYSLPLRKSVGGEGGGEPQWTTQMDYT